MMRLTLMMRLNSGDSNNVLGGRVSIVLGVSSGSTNKL